MHATDLQMDKFMRLFALVSKQPEDAPVESRVVADVIRLIGGRTVVCMRGLGTISVFDPFTAIEMQHPDCTIVPVQWPAIEDAMTLYQANDELLSSARNAVKQHAITKEALEDAYNALDSVWQTCSHEHWPQVGQAMDAVMRAMQ